MRFLALQAATGAVEAVSSSSPKTVTQSRWPTVASHATLISYVARTVMEGNWKAAILYLEGVLV
jgi:hypothetical protein